MQRSFVWRNSDVHTQPQPRRRELLPAGVHFVLKMLSAIQIPTTSKRQRTTICTENSSTKSTQPLQIATTKRGQEVVTCELFRCSFLQSH